MQALNYWKQFEHTGSVEDYLSYLSSEKEILQGKQKSSFGEDCGDKAGENPYAGIHMCNRDDIKTDAYRGI